MRVVLSAVEEILTVLRELDSNEENFDICMHLNERQERLQDNHFFCCQSADRIQVSTKSILA